MNEGPRNGFGWVEDAVWWFIIALAVVVALFVIPAKAETLEQTMLRHIDWIVANSDFEYNGEPLPAVRAVAQETLDNLAGGGSGGDIVAVYDHHVNTIYFPEGVDPLSWGSAPVLVHELAHYLQWVRGTLRGDVCVGEFEQAAYWVEDEWMDAHGHPGERSDPFFVIVLAASCRDPHSQNGH